MIEILPDELIMLIFEHTDFKTALYNLSRSSSRLYYVVLEFRKIKGRLLNNVFENIRQGLHSDFCDIDDIQIENSRLNMSIIETIQENFAEERSISLFRLQYTVNLFYTIPLPLGYPDTAVEYELIFKPRGEICGALFVNRSGPVDSPTEEFEYCDQPYVILKSWLALEMEQYPPQFIINTTDDSSV